jgi:hypothetical protein
MQAAGGEDAQKKQLLKLSKTNDSVVGQKDKESPWKGLHWGVY